MKAVIINDKIEIKDIELNNLYDNEARVELLYSGLCGSDMHKIKLKKNNGLELIGHEFVGRVISIINNSNINIEIGDIVVGNPLLPCNNCDNCKKGNNNLCYEFKAIGRNINGCFAEYIDVSIKNLSVVNDISPRLAVLADVVAVGLHAIDEFITLKGDEEILIIGDGAIGSSLLYLLFIKGVKRIYLNGKHRINYEYLKTFIPNLIFIDVLDEKNDYDYIFETVGGNQDDTIKLSIEKIGTRGKIIFLGVFPENKDISFNNRDLFLKEASLNSSVSYKTKYFNSAIEVLRNNPNFEKIITHEFDLINFKKGVDVMLNKEDNGPVIKVIYNNKNI